MRRMGEKIMTTTEQHKHDGGDTAAVAELITDIEGELRLHRARVLEFLDGTPEYEAITDDTARTRLLRLTSVIQKALDDIATVNRS
jgi:hypothetical protein